MKKTTKYVGLILGLVLILGLIFLSTNKNDAFAKVDHSQHSHKNNEFYEYAKKVTSV
ncbi:MAG: hypothetical protein WBP82_03885 [Leuconostoc mesenteroides]